MPNLNTYLILNPKRPSPSAHDKRIVCSNDSDDIDTLGLKLVVLCDVRRDMVRVAIGRERAGNGEEDNFLALPLIGLQRSRQSTGILKISKDGWSATITE